MTHFTNLRIFFSSTIILKKKIRLLCVGGATHNGVTIVWPRSPINLYVTLGRAHNEKS